jgi:hypothetical protein
MDLVRQILFEIEKRPMEQDEVDVTIEGYSTDEINYHLIILIDAALIRAEYQQNLRADYMWLSIRLTWDGHEFLDAARDDTRWERAKGTMMKTGGFVLPVLMQLLISYLKAELGLP